MKKQTIGIDFDNTIVAYDHLAVKLLRERHPEAPASLFDKTAVRDYLRSIGQEDIWTEMQGTLYGSRIEEASSFDGFMDFIREQSVAGNRLCVVSYKTRHPFKGPKYDLHQAAWRWLRAHGVLDYIDPKNVFFEETKRAKLERISSLGCSFFIDDLAEILTDPDFPAGVIPILFNPESRRQSHENIHSSLRTLATWSEASGLLT